MWNSVSNVAISLWRGLFYAACNVMNGNNVLNQEYSSRTIILIKEIQQMTTQKLKSQRELTKTYQKEQKYIHSQINKIKNLLKDRQS